MLLFAYSMIKVGRRLFVAADRAKLPEDIIH